jgi:hypothetical protein
MWKVRYSSSFSSNLFRYSAALNDLNKAIELSGGKGKAASQAYVQRAMVARLQDRESDAKVLSGNAAIDRVLSTVFTFNCKLFVFSLWSISVEAVSPLQLSGSLIYQYTAQGVGNSENLLILLRCI